MKRDSPSAPSSGCSPIRRSSSPVANSPDKKQRDESKGTFLKLFIPNQGVKKTGPFSELIHDRRKIEKARLLKNFPMKIVGIRGEWRIAIRLPRSWHRGTARGAAVNGAGMRLPHP